MALTGEPITAEEAMDAGMLSGLTEPGEALDAAVALAERIAKRTACGRCLEGARSSRINGRRRRQALGDAGSPSKKVFSSNDAKEGPVAFAENAHPIGQAPSQPTDTAGKKGALPPFLHDPLGLIPRTRRGHLAQLLTLVHQPRDRADSQRTR